MTEKPENVGMDSKSQPDQNRIDLANETAGLENGRLKRFFLENSLAFFVEREKKKAKREFDNLLDMLLTEDPIYAALYKKVTEKLEHAQQAVDSALIDINQRLGASDRELQFLRDDAAELQDGTKVFQSTDNTSIYTEHGKRLNHEKARNIKFSKNAPKWETYKAEKENHDIAARQKQEVEIYQRDVLDPTTKELKDKETPASYDRLKERNATINTEMPSIVKESLVSKGLSDDYSAKHPSTSIAHQLVEKTNILVSEIKQPFNMARTDIPDFGYKPEIESSPTNTSTLG